MLFNADNTLLFPYKVVIDGGPLKKAEIGTLKINVTITTQGIVGGLVFYGVSFNDDDDALLAKGAGQKLGLVVFSDKSLSKCVSISWKTVFPPPPPPPTTTPGKNGGNKRKICKGCRWDPFGIIFDSQSLEPLPKVEVTILDKNKQKYYLLGLNNPQVTLADGLFNFLVEPGIYYLTVSSPSGHNFTADPNLHPNYINVYYKIDGSDSIYKPDEPIPEIIDTPEEIATGKPDMEHRDIPLDPGLRKPYMASPSTISYKMTREGDITKVDGKVSHPYTNISFIQAGKTITKIQADRFGYFETNFSNLNLKQNKDISVLYTKADLKTIISDEFSNIFETKKTVAYDFFDNFINLFLFPLIPKTLAQSSTKMTSSKVGLTLPPILSYIEGFTFDKNNKIISNAIVQLKLKMNKASIYETKSDDNGYFKILPKYIPIFPYYLDFISQSGEVFSYTTSEFTESNSKYLIDNKIDLLNGTVNNKPVKILTAGIKKEVPAGDAKIIVNGNTNDEKALEKINTNKKYNYTLIVYLLIILIGIILIVIVVIFIIKSKKNNPTI
ncbi:hypothetical protein COT02_03975 [Candidatus Roizmanbacteria bacterium CG07_land_8_20_14_0_80_34_15]|uniref:Carboxypeptidase regulatory-like domain-containing protein n=1 Tax=Candidatus Roizmanbacteria bacterium CG07_land_8_20_14_0_80_34_15 TaxID=1974849 RepID=A0A2M6YTN6_9BACT|nr:MAG: hypothetical protein COT02_03975 [Candidatus Roizmanbacteria bacterium CG07_land_8_20_14_0_80_34_15]